jgi:hypothetical protein
MLPDVPPSPPAELVLSFELKRANLIPGVHTAPTAQCFVREAERNEIDPYVLLAVLRTEGGRPGEFALNRNGSADLGPMSINTVWMPTLAKRYKVSEHEIKQRVASDGCTNIAVAAWILGRKISETGSVWEGVANYHSSNPAKQGVYLMRVHARLAAILERIVTLTR